MTDLILIEECRNGNLKNFRKLVELTSPYAFSLAFRMLGNETTARDVVQDTMVTIWQKLDKIRSAEVYKTWIYRIVINKCYDHLRSKKRNPEELADEKTWTMLALKISEMPCSRMEHEENSKILGMLTERLSPKQKAIFILSEIEELTSEEISEITGISRSGIKANLHYARKSISGMIEKYL